MKHTRRVVTISAALLLGALTGSPAAWADVKGPGGKTIDCYCTDKQGQRMEIGEITCLHVDGRMFMAQCQMSLNVPMWREVQEGCLAAQLSASPLNSLPDRLGQRPLRAPAQSQPAKILPQI